MTQRTDSSKPTPIENATRDVLNILSGSITNQYRAHDLQRHHGTTEKEFRRIIALYFRDKSITDWCRDLGIEVPDGEQ